MTRADALVMSLAGAALVVFLMHFVVLDSTLGNALLVVLAALEVIVIALLVLVSRDDEL